MNLSSVDPGSTFVFFDGACPFCRSEMAWLRRRDRRGRLQAVDIADPAFDAQAFGLDRAELDRQLHVIEPGGRVARGMAAVRAIYRAVGLGWMAAPTGWPLLRPVFDRLYALFARNRRRWGAALAAGRRSSLPAGCARCRR